MIWSHRPSNIKYTFLALFRFRSLSLSFIRVYMQSIIAKCIRQSATLHACVSHRAVVGMSRRLIWSIMHKNCVAQPSMFKQFRFHFVFIFRYWLFDRSHYLFLSVVRPSRLSCSACAKSYLNLILQRRSECDGNVSSQQESIIFWNFIFGAMKMHAHTQMCAEDVRIPFAAVRTKSMDEWKQCEKSKS